MTHGDAPFDPVRRRVLQGLALTTTGLATGCGRAPDPSPTVDDVAQIDRTAVAGIVRPRDPTDVARRLADGRNAVSIGGARYSMGGQIAAPGSLHLDMRSLNRLVQLDTTQRIARVQAGMRWRDLQELIDPHGLAVKVMQSYSNFSIGGSVSVNCHGRYVGRGALVHTIRSLQVATADGALLEASRNERPDLFAAVVGGYGGVGVVTEVELSLDTNTRIERRTAQVTLSDYPAYFAEQVLADPTSVLHNADLTPPDFDQPLSISWHRTQLPTTDSLRLTPTGADYGRQQNLIWSATELPGRDVLRERFQTRRLLEEPAVVWLNREASLDAASLEPRTRSMSTYLLQEYFVPVAAFLPFAREMARVLKSYDTGALNVSIRHAPPDATSRLSWAHEPVFSFVLYHKQRQLGAADARAATWTRRLIDAALDHGGTYYLPYRLHASVAQFRRAYPGVDAFAQHKHTLDPQGRFRNRLWDRYLPR